MAKSENQPTPFDGVTRTRPARVTWANGDTRAYTVDVTFDGCALDTVLMLAMRSIIIDAQRSMRATPPVHDDGAKITFHASDFAGGARGRDPIARGVSVLDKLSDTDRAAIMERYGYTAK